MGTTNHPQPPILRALAFASLLTGTTLVSAGASATLAAQSLAEPFAPSDAHPFGRLNPAAPDRLSEYAFMIGVFECQLLDRESQDGSWVTAREGRATWRARWIMDGWAILDEFRDQWGSTNVNVRAFSDADQTWKVHWTTVAPTNGEIFDAGPVDDAMIMEFERETEGGFAYVQRFSFVDIEPDAYRWTNEIVYPNGTAVEIGWIECQRTTVGR